jgi:hypothetical protein
MAVVKHAINEGVAEVSDEEAAKLIASGGWVAADAPTKKTPHTRRRAAKAAE